MKRPRTKKKRVKNGNAQYYAAGEYVLIVKNYQIVTVIPRGWVQ